MWEVTARKTTWLGMGLSVVLILFFAPWGLILAAVYWVLVGAQRYRQKVEKESGENFENKNSLGLPFTSRW